MVWHSRYLDEFSVVAKALDIIGDMGNGGPQANSVFYEANGYSSYRDERWRVGKLLVSTFQI